MCLNGFLFERSLNYNDRIGIEDATFYFFLFKNILAKCMRNVQGTSFRNNPEGRHFLSHNSQGAFLFSSLFFSVGD